MAMIHQSTTARSFLAGAATTLTLVYLKSWLLKKKQHSGTTNATRRQQQQLLLLDSPDLDQRMIRKAEAAIRNRTSRLVVVIERCTNDFNYSAILRTVEALGIQHVYIVEPPRKNPQGSEVLVSSNKGQVVKNVTAEEISQRNQHALFAQRALEWLDLHEYDTTEKCLEHLQRDLGYKVWATDLSQHASCLTPEGLENACPSRNIDGNSSLVLPEKLAIVFGTEAVGCSNYMLENADLRVYLPLVGYADSLNLSVATALVIQQLFHLDPSLKASMSEEERQALRQKWFTKLASQRLLTSKQKKTKTRLTSQIRACEETKAKQDRGEHLHEPQLEKLAQLSVLRKELEQLEDDLYKKASAAVQELVQHPPEPLDDMRRADVHRACFVGRNTKARYTSEWKDMPATANMQTHATTSSYFRNLANENNDDDDVVN